MGTDRVVFYRKKRLLDTTPEWRWRYRAAGNSKILANGGESYKWLGDCVAAAGRVVGFDVNAKDNWDLIDTRPDGTEVFHVQRAGGGLIQIVRSA